MTARADAATPTWDGKCDVCWERRARWKTPGTHGTEDALAVCDVCRSGEPCGRCGVECESCECADGPQVFAWLEIAGRG